MNRAMIMALAMAVSSLAFGVQTNRAERIAAAGGFVEKPASGPEVVFLNSQKRVDPEVLASTCESIRKALNLRMRVHESGQDAGAELQKGIATKNVAAVVELTDKPDSPVLLIAPENRWAWINVSKLGEDKPSEAVFAGRVNKEIWRAFGYVMGAAEGQPPCLLQPIMGVKDLDALSAKTLSAEPFMRVVRYAREIGMSPPRRATYHRACIEGWAPAPTNDVQRAIWNGASHAGKAK